MPTGYLTAQPYGGLASSALGINPMFDLPENFTFEDLMRYEEARRQAAAQEMRSKLAATRAKLSESLNKQGQDLFSSSNPKILEDLNARGMFTSGSAVNQAQADALKEIALSNNKYLNDFDTAATGMDVSNEQANLENVLDIRRSELENKLLGEQANREQAFAESLANQQRRQGLTESLIGLGGQLGSAYLTSKMLGGYGKANISQANVPGSGIGGLLGLGTKGGSAAILARNAGTPTSSFFPNMGAVGTNAPSLFGSGGSLLNTAGTSAPGLGSLAGGLVGYEGGRRVFRPTQEGDRAASNVGAAIGGVGGSFFGPVGSAVGSFLGTAVGKAQNRIQKGVEKSLGGTAGSIAKYIQPTTAIASVGKKISKAFCFEGLTGIEMADGTVKPICEIDLDDMVRGGMVESLRVSKVDSGSMFRYKGVLVTGMHAVKEGHQWIRVKDSAFAEPVPGPEIVFSLVTSGHRLFSNGIEFADEHEHDNYEEMTIDQSLEELNLQEKVGVN